jgi:hypothetical protein
MLVITTVEETELLLTVGWIVSGIDIEQDLSQRLRVGCDPRGSPSG